MAESNENAPKSELATPAEPPKGQAPASAALQARDPVNPSQPQPSGGANDIRAVAIIGEVLCAGVGLVRALRHLGIAARVLCPSAAVKEAFLHHLATEQRAAAEGTVQVLLGSATDPNKLRELFEGVQALAFLSPVGIEGRVWSTTSHVEDLTQALAMAEDAGLRQVVYLSTLGADKSSPWPCFQEAAEAEALIGKTPLRGHVFRAGPLMGVGDGWLTRLLELAGTSKPVLVMWGYGDTFVQPMHTDDLGLCMAQSFVRPAEEFRAGIYAVAGKETFTLLELMDRSLEKRGRFKFKLHIPYFILRLLALVFGQPAQPKRPGNAASLEFRRGSFSERVGLLSEAFVTERNDTLKILGVSHRPKDLTQTLEEISGSMPSAGA